MKKYEKSSKANVLKLLRSLPQPGKILIDSLEQGISGISLRPKVIPGELPKNEFGQCVSVELKLMKNDVNFGENELRLRTASPAWLEWIKSQPIFVLEEKDIGQEISTIQERQKTFNKNTLHRFLDQFSITIRINRDDHDRLLDEDNYPILFWDDATCISGSAHFSTMQHIRMVATSGLEDRETIENRALHFKYWQILPEEKKPLMNVVIKWHKALINLYHLMRKGRVEIPINFKKLEKTCWDEINPELEKLG